MPDAIVDFVLRWRAVLAVALVLAFGGAPIASDWCTNSCTAAHMAHTQTADPVCHAGGPSSARVGNAPTPCGHDHGSTSHVMAADAATVSLVQPFAPVAVLVVPVAIPAQSAHASPIERDLSPPGHSVSLALAFSIRV